MNKYIPVSGFHTLDPIRNDPERVIEAILASMAGDHRDLKEMVPDVSEIENLVEGIPSHVDKATLLFLSCVPLLVLLSLFLTLVSAPSSF